MSVINKISAKQLTFKAGAFNKFKSNQNSYAASSQPVQSDSYENKSSSKKKTIAYVIGGAALVTVGALLFKKFNKAKKVVSNPAVKERIQQEGAKIGEEAKSKIRRPGAQTVVEEAPKFVMPDVQPMMNKMTQGHDNFDKAFYSKIVEENTMGHAWDRCDEPFNVILGKIGQTKNCDATIVMSTAGENAIKMEGNNLKAITKEVKQAISENNQLEPEEALNQVIFKRYYTAAREKLDEFLENAEIAKTKFAEADFSQVSITGWKSRRIDYLKNRIVEKYPDANPKGIVDDIVKQTEDAILKPSDELAYSAGGLMLHKDIPNPIASEVSKNYYEILERKLVEKVNGTPFKKDAETILNTAELDLYNKFKLRNKK